MHFYECAHALVKLFMWVVFLWPVHVCVVWPKVLIDAGKVGGDKSKWIYWEWVFIGVCPDKCQKVTRVDAIFCDIECQQLCGI